VFILYLLPQVTIETIEISDPQVISSNRKFNRTSCFLRVEADEG